jgi:molybdopterin-guanine dinucleotide biosynthesis protein A
MKTDTMHSRNPLKTDAVSGILLAGGESRRMHGINKALLEVGGRRIVERVAETLRALFDEVIVITNSPADFEFLGLPMFRDRIPGCGSLGGLYTGLSCCSGDYGFLVACDMPFVRQDVISYMLSLISDQDVVIPRIAGHFEPLHAIYSRRCVPFIEDLLTHADLKIIDLFDKISLLEVSEETLARFDPQLRFIKNLNTPEDLAKAREIASLRSQ